MKIKAVEIQGVIAGISEMSEIKLPGKLVYWLARTAKQLISEAQTLEETRVKLLEEHAEKDDNGKPVILYDKDDEGKDIKERGTYDLADEEAYGAAWKAVLEAEIEITMDALKPTVFDELEEKGIDIPTGAVYKLLPLFEE